MASSSTSSNPLNLERFAQRAKHLHSFWTTNKENTKVWKSADALCIVTGGQNENGPLNPTSGSIQRYLFAYEFPKMIILFTESKLIFVTTKKKGELFKEASQHLKNAPFSIQCIEKVKDNSWHDNFQNLFTEIKSSMNGQVIGTLLKEEPSGKFAVAWQNALKKSGLKEEEASTGFNLAMAVKDKDEVLSLKKTALLSTKAMKKFAKRMWSIIDEDKEKVKHSTLASEIENHVEDPTSMGQKNFDEQSCESVVTSVQSGSDCKLSRNLALDKEEENLSYDNIICQFAARYESYNANIARTYFVNAPKCVEKAYTLLLEVQQVCLSALKHDHPLKSVYLAAKKHIQTHAEELLQYFTPNCGTGIGIMLRDASHVLSHKNKRLIKTGMTFNLAIGFQGVPIALNDEEKGKAAEGARAQKDFSILLADTVLVGPAGEDATNLTAAAKKNFSTIAQDIGGDSSSEDSDSDSEEEEDKKKKEPEISRREQRQRQAAETKAKTADIEEKRMLILKKKQKAIKEAALRKRNKSDKSDGASGSTKTDEELRISAYAGINRFPTTARQNRLFVDTENQSIIVPIYNMLVPYHILTVKNVSINDEGHRASYLTINFYTPQDKITKTMPEKMVKAIEGLQARKCFVRSMQFKSINQRYLNDQIRAIKQLQKDTREKVREEAEKKDIIEQAALELWPRDRGRPLNLAPISVRPKIGKNRKNVGALQCHLNGFRFRVRDSSDKVDVLYSNVRHLIFQKCDGTIHDVILHMSLISPILVNKRRCKDLSFYMTVIDSSQALDESRRNMYDPDEVDEEQRQRKLRKRLNKNFYEFAQKVIKHVGKYAPDVEFPKLDAPYFDLSFQGTPNKEMVRISPSVDCLLNVANTPAFVITLDDVEHVHFERVNYSNKNFDMVLLMKDNLTFKPINAIPMQKLEDIKEWLVSIGKTFSTGNTSLKWAPVLSHVRELVDTILPDGTPLFWADKGEDGEKKDVGWDFLNVNSDHEDDEEDADEGSEFSMGSEEESSSEDDWEDDVVSEESGLDSEVYSGSEDEEAEDWDAMAKKAEQEDRRKRSREAQRGSSSYRPSKKSKRRR